MQAGEEAQGCKMTCLLTRTSGFTGRDQATLPSEICRDVGPHCIVDEVQFDLNTKVG